MGNHGPLPSLKQRIIRTFRKSNSDWKWLVSSWVAKEARLGREGLFLVFLGLGLDVVVDEFFPVGGEK